MSQYFIKVISVLLLTALFCSIPLFAEENSQEPGQNQLLPSAVNEVYKLGSGDVIKITVFKQEELSGEYTINGAGQIALPLIGDVNTKDLTVKQVEEAIANKLKPDYLLNPRVNVQVLNYRPFYILGEVKEPKSYP